MDLQAILVWVALVAAVFYLGKLLYAAIKPGKKKSSCGGCGVCADLSSIEIPKK